MVLEPLQYPGGVHCRVYPGFGANGKRDLQWPVRVGANEGRNFGKSSAAIRFQIAHPQQH